MVNRRRRALLLSVTLAVVGSVLVGLAPPPASAIGPNAIVTDAGCSANALSPADGGTVQVGLPFFAEFFGGMYNSLHVNVDGSITFQPSPGPPFNDNFPQGVPIIAPLYAFRDFNDPVGTTTYGVISFGGRTAFCVNWLNVRSTLAGNARNNSQLLLVDRADLAPGNFDVIFNYDRVQWDQWDRGLVHPQCNDIQTPCPPGQALAGYSSGNAADDFHLPGSGQPGALLDGNAGTGLVNHNLNDSHLGRYRFEFRETGLAAVQGVVRDDVTGQPVAGAIVQACRQSTGGCRTAVSSASGTYAFVGLQADTYALTVFPPAGSGYLTEYPLVSGLLATETRSVDVRLQTPKPLPNGSTLTPSANNPQGVPRVSWSNPLTLTTNGCPGGTATWEVRKGTALVRSGSMAEGPTGTYKTTIPSFKPTNGSAKILMAITCPDSTVTTVDFNIYIDPSGVVRDTAGTLLVGATVTLYRSDQFIGPFTQVPDGSVIMSPSNRKNPDVTDSVGHFGWDVIAGYYTVRASKAGCHNPANPAQAFVETPVMIIPPPVTDLDIRLQCPQTTSDFNPLTPARILDTRNGTGGITGKIGPGASIDVTVVGVGGVPATGVGAVVLNVTVTEPTAVSWLAVYPAGQSLPLASNLNFRPNQDVPNLVIAKVGAGGKVRVHNNVGSTHVAADVVGWFAAGATSFTSLTPARILDTRNGTGGITGKVGPGQSVDVTVVGVGGVPATGVSAVVLNVTVTEPTAPSWLAVYPAGQPLPLASNLNFVPNQDVPNLVIAKVGAGGKVTVHNNLGSTHVLFDVAGWLPPSPQFTSLTPARILDTRNGTGGITGKVGPGQSVDVTVVGVGGVPATGVSAVVLNVTVTQPTAASWLAVYPAGQPLPLASNLNFVPNQDVPNLVIAKVGAGGKVTVHNNLGSTHVVFDVMGSFAA